MRGGRRARAERQEARSRRLVTVRLGAHGCAREPGGQASAPLNRAPGTWVPRRRCPCFHPHECRHTRLDSPRPALPRFSCQFKGRTETLQAESREQEISH